MDVWVHTLITTVIVLILWPFFGPWALIAYIGGVLIDIDHALAYYIISRKISLKGTYDYCKDILKRSDVESYNNLEMIFHTFDMFLLSMIITFIWPILIPCLVGYIIHLALDLIHVRRNLGKWYFLGRMKQSALVILFNLIFKKH